jgi:hypothetical protein
MMTDADRAAKAEAALRQIAELLADWPTMRALSASGAATATANKTKARAIIVDVLGGEFR